MQSSFDNLNLRRAYWIALAVLLLLLVGSLLWYRERMFFVDSAYMAFNIINGRHLAIQEHRYGSFITQGVVLIGAQLRLSLRWIMLLYSVSFYAFYTAVVLVAGHWKKQYALGILHVFYLTLLVSDVYFWPNNEVHQGIGWMFLFLALFRSEHERATMRIWMHPVLLVCAFLAVFSHFIVIVPFSFLWMYYMLDAQNLSNTRRKKLRMLLYGAVIAVIFIIKYRTGRNGWYDGSKLDALSGLKHPDTLLAAFHNGHAQTMAGLMLRNYWLLPLMLIAGLAALLRNKKYLQAALTIAYATGFFGLVCITYPDAFGRGSLFYMESEWASLAIIAGAPFVFYVLPRIPARRAVAIMVFLFIVRLSYIGWSYQHFHKRLATLNTITENLRAQHITRAILLADKVTATELFTMEWGLQQESILLSQMKAYRPQITFKVADTAGLPPISKDSFIRAYTKDAPSGLDAHYFRLDSSSYQVLPLQQVLINNSIKTQ